MGFDWDRDYDDLVQEWTEAPCVEETEVSAPAASTAKTSSIFKWVALSLPAIVALSGALYLAAGRLSGGAEPVAVSIAVFDSLPQRSAAIAMPANLEVYDRTAFDRFVTGLARVSNNDLVIFANSIRRDVGDGNGTMAPYQRDALTLAQLEMNRRGLGVSRRAMADLQPVAMTANHGPSTHIFHGILTSADRR